MLKLAEEVVEADAMAANHHEISDTMFASQQLHLDGLICFDDFLVAIDGGEASHMLLELVAQSLSNPVDDEV